TTITVTGDQALELDYEFDVAATLKLSTVDASGQTDGGLSFSMEDLVANGTITLGAGDDIITGQAIDTTGVTTGAIQIISGLEKGSAEGLTAQDGFDVISFAGATQAADAEVA